MDKIRKLGLITVARGTTFAAAVEVSNALMEGSVLGIELTFTAPDAHRAMRELDEEHGDRILLGAGTMTEAGPVERAVESGVTFRVSPGCDLELLPLMRRTGLVDPPGVLTPSEVMLVLRFGVEVVKLSPGSLGEPPYVKAFRAPFPQVSFLPTGGVSENVADWFAAGAFAGGLGSALAPAGLGRSNERERVVECAARLVDAVCGARRRPGAKGA